MTDSSRRNRATSRARGRVSLVLVVAVALGAVVVAVSGVGVPSPGLRFAQSGHWVAQPLSGAVAHVDGATKQVDATARVPGLPAGAQVVQGADSGYVVGSQRIVEFGKSTLSVRRTVTPPVRETPLALEAAGGPFLIYQRAGRLVRFGPAPVTVPAGGSLGAPVITRDGDLWVQRTRTGVLCVLRAAATALSCPTTTPQGHRGQLSLVADRPVLLDTTRDTLRPVSDDGLGQAVPVGMDIPDQARVAGRDAAGRLPILDGPGKRLHFIDIAGLRGRNPAAPVSADLPSDSDYRGPDSTGSTVALLDVANHDLLTYRNGSTTPVRTPVPDESGEPRLSRGEDGNLYIDGAQGRHVMVVDNTGTVTEVPVAGKSPTTPSNPRPPLAEPQSPPKEQPPREEPDTPLPPIAKPPPQAPPPAQVTQPPPRAEPPRSAEQPDPPRAQPPRQPAPDPPEPRRPAPRSEPRERPAPNPRPDNPAPPANPKPDNPKPPKPGPANPRPNVPEQPNPPNSKPPNPPKPPNPNPPKPPKPNPPKPPLPPSPPSMPGSFTVLYDSYTTNALATWKAPKANGSPITSYYMSWSEGSQVIRANATSQAIEDFGNEEPFTVTLIARNAAGSSTPAVTTTIDGSTNPDCYEDWDQQCWDPETSPVPMQAGTLPNATPPAGQGRRRRD